MIPIPKGKRNPRISDSDKAGLVSRYRQSPVDRTLLLAQSWCGVLMAIAPSPMKNGLLILAAVVLAPVLLVGVVALAANDWRQVGATAGGDQVLVSSVTSRKNGLRTAWVRVEYKEPIRLPQGGPFVELRARVRFNCASAGARSSGPSATSRTAATPSRRTAVTIRTGPESSAEIVIGTF